MYYTKTRTALLNCKLTSTKLPSPHVYLRQTPPHHPHDITRYVFYFLHYEFTCEILKMHGSTPSSTHPQSHTSVGQERLRDNHSHCSPRGTRGKIETQYNAFSIKIIK